MRHFKHLIQFLAIAAIVTTGTGVIIGYLGYNAYLHLNPFNAAYVLFSIGITLAVITAVLETLRIDYVDNAVFLD
jgi:hypothetical protein